MKLPAMSDPVDPELQELRDLKAKLVNKVCKLRDELERSKNKQRSKDIRFEDLLPKICNQTQDSESVVTKEKDAKRLYDVSQSILGIRFENIKKHWIRDNIYKYTTTITSKAFQFLLDITVDVEGNDFTVQDINCHFVELDKCYLEEIALWIQRFTREKNFSYLISGVSDYSDQSVMRAKMLRILESRKYISMEKCRTEGGGIYVYVHPPGEDDRVFFKFHWSTKFVDRTWRIEHMFAIDPIEADETFVNVNEELLQGFCQIGLRKADLEDLWNRLCIAIDDAPKLQKRSKK